MKIISENEVDKAAVEYSEKVNGLYYNKLYPNCDETLGEVTIKEFKAGAKFAESKFEKLVVDFLEWLLPRFNSLDERKRLFNQFLKERNGKE